jgi:hypothetical protein
MSTNQNNAQKEKLAQSNDEQNKTPAKALKAAVFGASGAVGKVTSALLLAVVF